MKNQQTACLCCGTCCVKGGPALHLQDLPLLQSGQIPLKDLLTLRKGELAHNPVTDRVQPVSCELVKLKGTGADWTCCYFDSSSKRCSIYDHRPSTCTLLKCWEPDGLLEMVEKETLTRLDILGQDHPLATAILEHEELCPCPDMALLQQQGQTGFATMAAQLEQLVNADIGFRNTIVARENLAVSEELFYFGRPLFQLLRPLGIVVAEVQGRLSLRWNTGPR